MVQWSHERAQRTGPREGLTATDDGGIVRAAPSFGAGAVLTAASHASGTDRIAEVAPARRWPREDIVVNVQGAAPLIPQALIPQGASLLHARPASATGTLATPIPSVAVLLDPHTVKVVPVCAG